MKHFEVGQRVTARSAHNHLLAGVVAPVPADTWRGEGWVWVRFQTLNSPVPFPVDDVWADEATG